MKPHVFALTLAIAITAVGFFSALGPTLPATAAVTSPADISYQALSHQPELVEWFLSLLPGELGGHNIGDTQDASSPNSLPRTGVGLSTVFATAGLAIVGISAALILRRSSRRWTSPLVRKVTSRG